MVTTSAQPATDEFVDSAAKLCPMLRHLRVSAMTLLVLFSGAGLAQTNPAPKNQNGIAESAGSSSRCGDLRRRSPEFGPLADACEYAFAGPRTLPNFVCTEKVEQYLAPEAKPRIITAELTIDQTRNHYTNVTLDGALQTDEYRSTDELFEELVASTGEFAMLFHVFSASSQTQFSAPVAENLNGVHLKRYDFRVKRENNTGWTWLFPNLKINPGYHGSIFVDPSSGKIFRLTVQVSQSEVDPQTPVSDATTTVDYGDVSITEAGTYHLPVQGQNISCFPILNGCIRAELTFSNFHKFGSSVRILTGSQ